MDLIATEAYEFQVQNNFISAGQPTKERLIEVVQKGAIVVSLRAENEDPYPVEALIKELDGTFYRLATAPFSYDSEEYRQNLFELFDRLLEQKKMIYLHCGSANRTGAAWAIYLKIRKNMPAAAALNEGIKAGMRSLEPKIASIFQVY